MIPGLDEFMLRLGHLKVLSNVATESGGSRYRVEKLTSELLISDSSVSSEAISGLTEYLYRKRLCVIELDTLMAKPRNGDEAHEQVVRYPELVIVKGADGGLRLTNGKAPISTATVWWQDRCLADLD